MIVVITGGRDYTDGFMVRAVLDGLNAQFDPLIVYHGGAKGADRFAAMWADDAGVEAKLFTADWEKHGKAAGPIRNEQMLADAILNSTFEEDAPIVLAFKNGFDRTLETGGTEHMCLIARLADVTVVTIERLLDGYEDHPRIYKHPEASDQESFL